MIKKLLIGMLFYVQTNNASQLDWRKNLLSNASQVEWKGNFSKPDRQAYQSVEGLITGTFFNDKSPRKNTTPRQLPACNMHVAEVVAEKEACAQEGLSLDEYYRDLDLSLNLFSPDAVYSAQNIESSHGKLRGTIRKFKIKTKEKTFRKEFPCVSAFVNIRKPKSKMFIKTNQFVVAYAVDRFRIKLKNKHRQRDNTKSIHLFLGELERQFAERNKKINLFNLVDQTYNKIPVSTSKK